MKAREEEKRKGEEKERLGDRVNPTNRVKERVLISVIDRAIASDWLSCRCKLIIE